LPEDVRNKLVIKVVETKTRTMIDKCLELTAYDAMDWTSPPVFLYSLLLQQFRQTLAPGLCQIQSTGYVRNKLVIKVVETKTRTMIDKCLELTAYDAQYRIPWIVFDRDQVLRQCLMESCKVTTLCSFCIGNNQIVT